MILLYNSLVLNLCVCVWVLCASVFSLLAVCFLAPAPFKTGIFFFCDEILTFSFESFCSDRKTSSEITKAESTNEKKIKSSTVTAAACDISIASTTSTTTTAKSVTTGAMNAAIIKTP